MLIDVHAFFFSYIIAVIDDLSVAGPTVVSSNTHPSFSTLALDDVPVAASSIFAPSSPTPSPAVISATPQSPIHTASLSAESVTRCHRKRIWYSAKVDAYMCRTWQEEYHKLKIAQMKEMHALQMEQKNFEMSLLKKKDRILDYVHRKLSLVIDSAKKCL